MTDATIDPIQQLTGPGGPFEIVRDDVAGVELQVYKERLRAMAELVKLADGHGDADFIVQGDRRLSFAEHNRAARAVAAGLIERGVKAHDRVAVLSANNPEWCVAFWACALTGAVCVPLNAWWKTEELEFGLADSGTRVLICDARRWEVVRPVVDSLGDLEHVFVIGDDAPAGPAEPFAVLDDGGDPGYPEVAVAEDDIAGIFYTSGTTGRPKGATVTHRQVIANLQNIMVAGISGAMRAQLEGTDSATPETTPKPYQQATLLVVPLFHTTGCHATMVVNLAAGYKLVLMPPGRFDPDLAMELVEREKIGTIGGVPTVMWRIIESPNFGTWDLSTVTRVSYGGAPASPELVERLNEAFPNARKALTNGYGLTETASVATLNVGKDYIARPSSAGKPVPTVELRVVDEAGHDVPPGTPGEIWFRGPTISPHGYWKRPDANAETYAPGRWLRTGDVGKLDADGFLYIVDRAKDVIIRGGENVYCVEVEEILYDHPDVIDAAVVGVPHRELGEEVKAVVHTRPGAAVTDHELRDFCAARLAPFKVPTYVELRPEPLPRNPAGKILKSALKGGTTAFDAAGDTDQAL